MLGNCQNYCKFSRKKIKLSDYSLAETFVSDTVAGVYNGYQDLEFCESNNHGRIPLKPDAVTDHGHYEENSLLCPFAS